MSDPLHPAVAVGDLLVAAPELLDPNFEHSVVLVLDLDDNGALGVVLNRPSAVPVAEVLPEWGDLAGVPGVLFQGGPVSTDAAIAVAASRRVDGPSPVVDPAGFRPLYDDVGIVDLDTPLPELEPVLRSLRIFAGYAGWGAEQLATEIREGAWYVVPSVPEDLFCDDPLELWKQVLRRQPGELAWVSTRPVDPSQN
ncbi:MAG TPA: YqgE/AlgH family protein [Nocardioidaceae bacterium]|nr:YqgE/AlgH family protein [Nocardioidaceae bacterium]